MRDPVHQQHVPGPPAAPRPLMSSRGWLLTRAFLVWGLFTVLGFLPDVFLQLYNAAARVKVIFEPVATEPLSAWIGFTHFAGFSVFLLMVTNKKRWLVFPVVSTVTWMWLWRWFHVPPQWWAFATHTLGYVLMGSVLLVVMGVLSGLAYLWVELLAFLRNLYVFYPQVKEELKGHPLLEAVIVSNGASTYNSSAGKGETSAPMRKIINASKQDDNAHCFLCKRDGIAYVEVCSEWVRPSAAGNSMSICTPFATLKESHRNLEAQLVRESALVAQLRKRLDDELHEKIKLQQDLFGQRVTRSVPIDPAGASSSSSRPRPPTSLLLVAAAPAQALPPSAQLAPPAVPPPPPPPVAADNDDRAGQKRQREVRHLLSVIETLEKALQDKDVEVVEAQQRAHEHSERLQAEAQELQRRLDAMEREKRLMSWVAQSVSPLY